MKIIDAHSHLWLKQDTNVNGLPVKTLKNGRSLFMGEERQMLPPFLIYGRNSAEVFLSNMDYAQVSAAVVTQEYIDGNKNDYLLNVAKAYPAVLWLRCASFVRMVFYEAERLIEKDSELLRFPLTD